MSNGNFKFVHIYIKDPLYMRREKTTNKIQFEYCMAFEPLATEKNYNKDLKLPFLPLELNILVVHGPGGVTMHPLRAL